MISSLYFSVLVDGRYSVSAISRFQDLEFLFQVLNPFWRIGHECDTINIHITSRVFCTGYFILTLHRRTVKKLVNFLESKT